MEKQEFKFSGYAFVHKTVKNAGDSGRVFVPKSWQDKKVVVILAEPPDE